MMKKVNEIDPLLTRFVTTYNSKVGGSFSKNATTTKNVALLKEDKTILYLKIGSENELKLNFLNTEKNEIGDY